MVKRTASTTQTSFFGRLRAIWRFFKAGPFGGSTNLSELRTETYDWFQLELAGDTDVPNGY